MADWTPGDFTPAEAADRLARAMAGMYGRAEQALTAELARVARQHLAGRLDKLAALREMRMAAQRIVAILHTGMPSLAESIIAEAARSGTQQAMQQLRDTLGDVDMDRILQVLPGALAAEAIAADLTSALDQMHLRILRYADDAYRAVIAATAPQAVLGLTTARASSRAAWDRLVAQGVTGFVDRAGRNWNLATYTEMATRTAIIRAYSDANQHRLAQAGISLYQVIVGNDACQKCAAYAGLILSADSVTGPHETTVQHATQDDIWVTVQVADSVTGAKENGWRHPNCRCTLIGYFPGLDSPATVTQTTYNPVMEAEREQLRALERDVRKEKLREAGALTPEDAAESRSSIRLLQARIREHIDATGLMRQRDREQIDYGFHSR